MTWSWDPSGRADQGQTGRPEPTDKTRAGEMAEWVIVFAVNLIGGHGFKAQYQTGVAASVLWGWSQESGLARCQPNSRFSETDILLQGKKGKEIR